MEEKYTTAAVWKHGKNNGNYDFNKKGQSLIDGFKLEKNTRYTIRVYHNDSKGIRMADYINCELAKKVNNLSDFSFSVKDDPDAPWEVDSAYKILNLSTHSDTTRVTLNGNNGILYIYYTIDEYRYTYPLQLNFR